MAQADAVVGDAKTQPPIADPRRDLDAAGGHSAGQAMANRIFDERLQNEARHQAIERATGHVVVDAQPIGESQALYVEVRLDRDELLAKRELAGARDEGIAKDERQLA